MKTAYEGILGYYLDLEYKFQYIKQLIKLSKKIPWILDLKVKFKGMVFNFLDKDLHLSIYATKINAIEPNRVYVKIENYANSALLENPNLFMEYVTKRYNLQPGWMQIEDSI